MVRKNFLTLFITAIIIAAGSFSAMAQIGQPVGGQVITKGADGKNTGIAGATVDVYRTDIKAKGPSAKTDKKGYFRFAGLALGAEFILSVSGPGISPTVYPGVRAGNDALVIEVQTGDGKVLTEAEARQIASTITTTAPGQTESPDEKKRREEEQAKIAEVQAKNKKIEETNQIVNNAVTEGRAALDAKNFDLAVQKFKEGFEADPTFAGTAPFFLNSLALSLVSRGTDKYNSSVTTKEPDAKTAAREAAKADFDEAVSACDKSLEILKDATSTDPAAQKNYEANKAKALEIRKNAFRLMAQTGVNRTRGDEAAKAFAAYLEIETDAAKKTKAEMDLAYTLMDSDQFENAIVEFEKILAAEPNNVDALVGRGLCLVTVGYVTMDTDQAKGKAQLQDAANTLQKFVDLAPEGHKFKQSALDSIAQLKDIVTPQKTNTKTTPTTRKKP